MAGSTDRLQANQRTEKKLGYAVQTWDSEKIKGFHSRSDTRPAKFESDRTQSKRFLTLTEDAVVAERLYGLEDGREDRRLLVL